MGADPDIQNKAGNTALIEASRIGNVEIVRRLLRAGAPVNAQNKDGLTALIMAVGNNRPDVVSDLISAKAGLDIRDKLGNTALTVASRYSVKSANRLLTAGANINAPNNAGDTPLAIALRYNHDDLVDALFNMGADIDQSNAVLVKRYQQYKNPPPVVPAVVRYAPVEAVVRERPAPQPKPAVPQRNPIEAFADASVPDSYFATLIKDVLMAIAKAYGITGYSRLQKDKLLTYLMTQRDRLLKRASD